MSLTPIRTKWLTGVMAATLSLALYTPVSMAADSQNTNSNEAASTVLNPNYGKTSTQRYSDISENAWYAEAVNEWIARGILSPQPEDEFKPEFIVTRGDFALLLAYSLGLAPSEKSGVFKDLPDGNLAGYIVALQEAGLAHGYPDGTFRSNLPLTRAQTASWLAKAQKLTLETQTSSQFPDVKPTSWYAGAVDALARKGIVSEKTRNLFAPNDVITRAETINLLYRSFYKAALIQDIQDDGTIIIDGTAYRASDSVKGIFQSSNKAVLHNAAIQFTRDGDTIVSVESLIIGYKKALDGQNESHVFNADGNAINGEVTVDADQVTLTNLEVKGNLILTPAFQTDFFAYDVLVRGETVYLEDTSRPKSQVANIEFKNSELGKLIIQNSVNLKQIDVVSHQVSKSNQYEGILLANLGNFQLPSPGNAPSSPVLAPGLYVQVIDGLINVTNKAGSQNFTAGQFGFTPSFTQPPIILPSNPGLQFTPPPSFNAPSPTSGVIKGKEPIRIFCTDVDCNIEAYANSKIDSGTTGTFGTVTVNPGTTLEYLGSKPIGTLILGGSNSTGQATFIGSTNIDHVIVNGNGQVNLNLQGRIGTLEITGTSPLVLTGLVTIDNLIVPPGIDPKSLFTNPDDLSRVSAINGQPIAPATNPNPPVETNPNPPVETNPNPPVETDPNPPVETNPNPPVETDPNPPVETDPNPPVETNPNPPVETDPNPPVETNPNPPVETDPNPPVETDPNPPVETDPNPPVETDPNPPVETDPNPPVD